MKVKDLKLLLEGLDDNLNVVAEWDGKFIPISLKYTGVSTFSDPCDEGGNSIEGEEHKEYEVFVIEIK